METSVTPTVLRVGPYRLFFFAGDRPEPRHVHVERDGREAKFWLESMTLVRNRGFSRLELSRVTSLVRKHRAQLMEAWDAFFSE